MNSTNQCPSSQVDRDKADSTAAEPSWPRLSFHRDDLPCTGMGVWQSTVYRLRCWRWNCLVVWNKWRMAFRSFRGHIRLLSPKGMPVLILGEVTSPQPEKYREEFAALQSRSASKNSLSAMYPWVDLVDTTIFLMGYREGLQQTLRTSHTETSKPQST